MAGGIPLIRPLRESLAGEHITAVMGIVNGTTNFILTRMTEDGRRLRRGARRGAEPRLRRARPDRRRRGLRRRGQGGDHRHASPSAPGCVAGDVYHEGISGITADRHRLRRPPRLRRQAARHRRAQRRAPTAPRSPCGSTRRWCRPTHPLAAVRDSFNAVFVEGAAVGDLMFYGRGAGGGPTASAVLGDLIDAAVNLRKGTHATHRHARPRRRIRPIDEVEPRVLPEPRRRRPARRARRGRRGVRAPRRVDPLDGAGGPRRRGPPHLHHPRGPRGRRAGARCATCASSTRSTGSASVLRGRRRAD